jgi:hypothetical protein
MTGERFSAATAFGSATIESCWMCGIRVRVDQLIADGGSACPDVRWYCRDMHGCTQRWTMRLHHDDVAAATARTSLTRRSIAG